MIRSAAVPDRDRSVVGRRTEGHAVALNADDARPVAVLRRREGVGLAALHLRLGADSQRKECRSGRLGSCDFVGDARRGAEGPFAEIRLGGDGGVRVCGNAHEVHETGFARRRAPRLPRRGGNAEERLFPDVGRIDHIDAPARKRGQRRGRLVAGNPHAVGERLLVDGRSVVRDLARGRVGVGRVRRDALDRSACEEVFARGVHRRRFEVDCVPPLRERHRLLDVRRLRRERHKRHKGQKRQVSSNVFHGFHSFNFKLQTSNFKL